MCCFVLLRFASLLCFSVLLLCFFALFYFTLLLCFFALLLCFASLEVFYVLRDCSGPSALRMPEAGGQNVPLGIVTAHVRKFVLTTIIFAPGACTT